MKIGRAFSSSIIWRGIYFISVLFLNILISRYFKAEGSGQIYYITSVLAFFVLPLGFCLEVPMGYYLSKKKINETRLAVTAVFWCFIIALPTYLIILFVKNSTAGLKIDFDFVFSAFVFLTGNILISFFVGLFYAKFDFVLPNLLLVSVNVLLMFFLPGNPLVKTFISDTSYINIYFLSYFLQGGLLAFAFFIKYFKLSDLGIIPVQMFRSFIMFAFFVLVTNILSYLINRVDYWFVNKYTLSPEYLGNYIQASKVAQMFYLIPSILASVIFPATASGISKEINEKLQTVSRGIVLFYILGCLVIAFAGYWLFPFVFGSTFQFMYLPFILLIPGIIAHSVAHLLAAFFSGEKKLAVGIITNLLTLIVIIAGDILLIPKFGINGAAIVSSLGYIVLMIALLFVHQRKYNSRFFDFLIIRKSDMLLLRTFFQQAIIHKKREL